MKRKTILFAMLVGALSLGSCVDDKESASVEAVRNSKAEQLKSVAAMNNAQAEATKLLAEAEAALIKAEVEAQQIMNDHEKGIAAQKLEQAILDLEAKLLQAQAELLQAQMDLKNAQANLDAEERDRLNNLATAYSTAVSMLNTAKKTLAGNKTQLLLLENNLTTAQAVKEKEIADLTKANAAYQAHIDIYKVYTGITAAQKEAKLIELVGKIEKAELVADAAYNKYREADAVIRKYDDYGDLMAGTYYDLTYSNYYGIANKYTSYTDIYTVHPVKDLYKTTRATIEYSYQDNEYVQTYSYSVLAYCIIDKELFEVVSADLRYELGNAEDVLEAVEDQAELLKKAADKAYNDWQGSPSKYYDYVEAKAAYDDYVASTLAYAQSRVDYWKKEVATFNADRAFLTNSVNIAAYKKMVDAYNASEKKLAELYVAYRKAEYITYIVEAEFNAINNIYAIDTDAEIARMQTLINMNDAFIINANATFADKEDAIEYLKATIEAQEAKVVAAEAAVKQAKAALDAALAE